VKRDMDLVRDILLAIEGGQKSFSTMSSNVANALGVDMKNTVTDEAADQFSGHLDLLVEAGLITIKGKLGGGIVLINAITWEGHDFLDNIRDPDVWDKTKAGAEKVGSFSIDVLKAIAKGLIKEKLQKHTGVEIDI